MASITLLTCYGISKTPLFFRYKNVSEIPSFSFRNRQTIHGRIVHIVEPKKASSVERNAEEPIVCLVRQLSPVRRLWNKSTYENFMETRKLQRHDKDHDLIKVEIAGIKAPPLYHTAAAQNGREEGTNYENYLKRLASDRIPVSCTLISRRILKLVQNDGNLNQSHGARSGSIISSSSSQWDGIHLDPEYNQVAIAKIKYRSGNSFFRKQDLASSLVSCGRANVALGMHIEIPSMPTVDASTKLGDIESDVKYMDHLSKLEYEAFKARMGMWNVDDVRSMRPDLVEEVEFEVNASRWKKLWRSIREGEFPWFFIKRNR